MESPLHITNTLIMEQNELRQTRAYNILDLCFPNNMDIIHDLKVTQKLVSDHNMIEL